MSGSAARSMRYSSAVSCAAAEWLDRCLERRPDDLPVWLARLDLAMATDDEAGLWTAVEHLPAGGLEATEVRELRAWLAARRGEPAIERRELTALVDEDPGNTRALERLALLETRAGRLGEAEQLHRRKAEVDRTQHQFNAMLLDGGIDSDRAGTLAKLATKLGRSFEARAWALLAEAMIPVPGPPVGNRPGAESPSKLARRATEKAVALSAPYADLIGRGASATAPLGDRLADLRPMVAQGRETRSSVMPAAGGTSSSTPEFVDAAAEVGLRFTFDNGRTPERLLPETLSGGVGLLDFDGDGWLDVYCVQGGAFRGRGDDRGAGVPPGDRLFRNRGDGTFEDATEASGIAAIACGRGYGMGVAVGDYDNDGHPDLFVTRLRSLCPATATGETARSRTPPGAAGFDGTATSPTSAAFADLDDDGDLDLYVCHYMRLGPRAPASSAGTRRPDRSTATRAKSSRPPTTCSATTAAGSWT